MTYQPPGGSTPPPPPAWQPPPRRGLPIGAVVGIIAGVVVVVGAAVAIVVIAARGDGPAPSPPGPAETAQQAVNCSEVVEEPATMEPYHLDPGEPMPQTDRPATSGPHAASTLSPGVYTSAVDEAQAVHNLEHGYVVIWYDPSVASQEAIDAVAAVAQGQRVVMAPYDLQAEFTFTSWERIQSCDPGADIVGGQQAASSFIATYVDSPNAPEAGVG